MPKSKTIAINQDIHQLLETIAARRGTTIKALADEYLREAAASEQGNWEMNQMLESDQRRMVRSLQSD